MLGPLFLVAVLAAANACRSCTCGIARSGRVVGGDESTPGEFPWLAALTIDGVQRCGATVVTKDHLITATHCVFEVETSRLKVWVGQFDLNYTRGEAYEVAQVSQHPDYNRFTFDNDIAVLRLAEPLPDRLFKPACLPETDNLDTLEGLEVTVTGWGATVELGSSSNIPRKADVQIWAQEECIGAVYGKRKVTPRMLCANAPNRDSCGGDSGGPLLLQQPHSTVIGIVSWGRGCARQGYPGVYSRVDKFLPWLKAALRHTCLCEPPSYY